MMMMSFEIYEALKPHVGEEGARLIAERIPQPQDLATRADLQQLAAEMREAQHALAAEMREAQHTLAAEVREAVHGVQVQILDLKAETRRWLLSYFVPLWIGVYGTIAAIVVTHMLR